MDGFAALPLIRWTLEWFCFRRCRCVPYALPAVAYPLGGLEQRDRNIALVRVPDAVTVVDGISCRRDLNSKHVDSLVQYDVRVLRCDMCYRCVDFSQGDVGGIVSFGRA